MQIILWLKLSVLGSFSFLYNLEFHEIFLVLFVCNFLPGMNEIQIINFFELNCLE